MNSGLNELLHLWDISSAALVAQHEITWRNNEGYMKHSKEKWIIDLFFLLARAK